MATIITATKATKCRGRRVPVLLWPTGTGGVALG